MRKTIHSKEQKLFIQALKNARKEAGLTQQDVAQKLKCSQAYISKLESGELRVDVLLMQKLAKIYRKDMPYFIKE